MKFTIAKDYLMNALNVVVRAISPKNPNPILTGIKFELNSNGLYLTGSDSDLSILTKIPLKENDQTIITVADYGIAIISSRYVLDIIRKLEGSSVEFEVIDNTVLIRDQISEFKLNCMSTEDYPPLEIDVEGVKFGIDAALVKQIVDQVGFAASTNENRPILTGVNFKSNGHTLTCVATDSFRLARKVVPIETGSSFNITIPAKTLAEIGRVLDNERNVELNLNDKRACFKMVHTIVVSRVISNPYPNTDQIVPENFGAELTVGAQGFCSAIDRASLLASANTNIVQLSADSQEVKISSRNQEVGSVIEKISTFKYQGDKLDISFSAKFAMEAIRALGSEEVTLKFNESAKPFVVVNKNDPSVVQLILPAVTY